MYFQTRKTIYSENPCSAEMTTRYRTFRRAVEVFAQPCLQIMCNLLTSVLLSLFARHFFLVSILILTFSIVLLMKLWQGHFQSNQRLKLAFIRSEL